MAIPQLRELGFAKFQEAEWREYQAETLAEAIGTDKKFILVQAPTGFGKSPLAMAAGKLVAPQVQRAIGNEVLAPQSSVLTGTKQLQKQYLSDFEDYAVEVKGRGNFGCLDDPQVTAADASCTVGSARDCDYYAACPYYRQRNLALDAPEVIHSYAYGLRSLSGFGKQSLMVLDEAHLLDDQLMSYVTSSVHRFACDMFDVRYPPANAEWSWSDWHSWAEVYHDELRDAVRALRKQAEENVATRKRFRHGQVLAKTLELLVNAEDPWVCVPSKTGWDFMPVWIDKLADAYLYQRANKVMLMSGTILDPELFSRIVGIDPADTHFIDVPSTFPIGSKPVIYWPAQAVKSGIDLTDTVERVNEIIEDHPGQKGLVHCVSYAVADAIRKGASKDVSRRLVSHTASDRLEVYDAFRVGAPDGVLLSPSMKEGVSLEDEQCEFIVIPKMPYPYLGSPQIKARMQTPFGQRWYAWRTFCDTIQMAGRGMRSKEDHCKVYITDANFARLFRQMRKYIPRYWLDDLVDTTGSL